AHPRVSGRQAGRSAVHEGSAAGGRRRLCSRNRAEARAGCEIPVTETMTAIRFYIFAAILVVAACRVIIARSPVTAVMHLGLSFFTASMIWMLLNAEFLAILLVLVYVGAVMVLFLFVVMMLDIDSAKLREGFRAHLPLGMIVGAIMVAEMAFVLASAYWDPSVAQAPADFNNTRAIGVA